MYAHLFQHVKEAYTLYLFLHIPSSSTTGHKQRDTSLGVSFPSMHRAQCIIIRVLVFSVYPKKPCEVTPHLVLSKSGETEKPQTKTVFE